MSINNNPLISIIVPVYNSVKYLDCCLETILNQTYKNIEVILIDDGSTDGSEVKCDLYAKKDHRVKVIHTQNRGAGAARNYGLKLSNGQFISFVDSDDILDLNMLQCLYSFFDHNTDIVECGYSKFEDLNITGINPTTFPKSDVYSASQAMELHITNRFFEQVIWNKLYRKELIDNIYFPENSKIDDEFWTYRVIAKANYLKKIDCILYHYRNTPNSIMNSISLQQRFESITALTDRLNLIKANFTDLYPKAVFLYWGSMIYFGQLAMNDYSNTKEIRKLISDHLKENRLSVSILKKYGLESIWISLSSINFWFVCYLRNLLRIGL